MDTPRCEEDWSVLPIKGTTRGHRWHVEQQSYTGHLRVRVAGTETVAFIEADFVGVTIAAMRALNRAGEDRG